MNHDEDAAVPVITIDGPSGAGKGTLAQQLALTLGWHYLDSGAVYRALAYVGLRGGLISDDAMDEAKLVAIAAALTFSCRADPSGGSTIYLDGADVSDALRSEEVGKGASRIATSEPIRAALLGIQRGCRQAPGLVADGRDMGSRVFGDAKLKIFLTATPKARAERRHKQLRDKGFSVNLANLRQAIDERDARDQSRRVSPLRPADDAITIDSSDLDEAQTLAKVIATLPVTVRVPR